MGGLRVLAARRWGVLFLAVALAAAGVVLRPRESAAVVGAAAECNLVVLQVWRYADGTYELRTANTGICVISEYDPVHLPDDAGQTGSISISGRGLGGVCVAGRVASLNGHVSVALRGSSSNHPIDDVSVFVTNAAGAAPTAAFVRPVDRIGSGQFVASGSGCASTGLIETWSFGTIVFDELAPFRA